MSLENSVMYRTLKKLIALFLLLMFVELVAATNPSFAATAKGGINPKRMTAKSGVVYTLFPQGKLRFDFLVVRPLETNDNFQLCIPAAFTTPANEVDGFFISNGTIGQTRSPNSELGGAAVIKVGKCKLLSTDKGRLISEDLIESIEDAHGSLFQQFLIVHGCKAASFRDKTKFQRRAIFEDKNGSFGIVESDRAITFNVFNADLVELGMKEALYCDMGAWDEGWYRDATTHKIVRIGLDRSLTSRQSNWLVLKTALENGSADKKAHDKQEYRKPPVK